MYVCICIYIYIYIYMYIYIYIYVYIYMIIIYGVYVCMYVKLRQHQHTRAYTTRTQARGATPSHWRVVDTTSHAHGLSAGAGIFASLHVPWCRRRKRRTLWWAHEPSGPEMLYFLLHFLHNARGHPLTRSLVSEYVCLCVSVSMLLWLLFSWASGS